MKMITKCLSKWKAQRTYAHYVMAFSLSSSLCNLNHRINNVFPRAVSPEQDVNPFPEPCPWLGSGPCPLEPGVWGWSWLAVVKCPSLPGIPAKIPGLHISLISEEALFGD